MTDFSETAIEPTELPSALEALLFAAAEPQTIPALADALNVKEKEILEAIKTLESLLEGRGIRIHNHRGTYSLASASRYAPWITNLLAREGSRPLSPAALEVLSIIAFKQPCTRGQVEVIRGVNSDGVIVSLEQRALIEVCGSAETPGRANLYRPTTRFFEQLGLRGPHDLPDLPDLATESKNEGEEDFSF